MKTAGRPVRCLICGGRRPEVVRVVPNLDPNTEGWVDRMAVAVCRDCGLVYQSPRLSEKAMDAHYEKAEDKITASHTDTVTLAENASRVEALKRLLPKGGRVLEIGCSDGTFLDLARRAGFSVLGIDPSEANCAKARREHPRVEVRRMFLADFPATEKFDAICHFFVLEHIFHPKPFLAQIRRQLAPGGLNFFEIPNVENFGKLPFANNLFIYQHVAHYGPGTVRALLAANGFRTVGVDGALGRSPKSYGMRVAARPAPRLAGRPANLYPASRRMLDRTFAKRDRLVRRMESTARRLLAGLKRPGPVVVFGAGENGRLLARTTLARAGRDLYFCDNNGALQGRAVEGRTVLAPAQVPALDPALVITASIDYQKDMKRQLVALSVPAARIASLYEGF